MRRLVALTLALAAAPATPALAARTLTIRQPRAPQLTLTVPAGWHAHVARRRVTFRRGRERVRVVQCPLDREERDMTGDHAARLRHKLARGIYGERDDLAAAAGGGSCVLVTGKGALALARRLHPRLGPPGPAPASNTDAERLARAARQRTLALPRAEGTAAAVAAGGHIESEWEYDLPAGYSHQEQEGEVGDDPLELDVVHARTGDYVRGDDVDCWSSTNPPDKDDALEPRLELQEWNVPPARATAWRVAYAAPEPQPDGSTRVRWTGFVADGAATIGPDGLLRSVSIADHRQARGRTTWTTVQVAFTGFPPAITPVRPDPVCR